jgi:hypothetical protein
MKGRIAIALVVAVGLLVVSSGSALASQTVPFRGMDRGGFTIPGECADGAQVVIGGVGTATGLGRYGFTSVECFNPDTGAFAGTPTFIGADGDTLTGSYEGTVGGTDDPNVITYDEELTITGGTGRFADATGALDVHGIANLATGEYVQWLRGTITKS